MITSTSSLMNLRGVWRENHPLGAYTSWRVGGVARYFYQPANLLDLQIFLKEIPADLPIVWLGAGSNVLIRDTGIAGLVVCVRGCLGDCKLQSSGRILVQAGVSCSKLLQIGVREGMLDMAFLAGIPGTIGGALAMNAGAYGDTIWQHVSGVTTINRNGELIDRKISQFDVGYRQVAGLSEDEWFVSCCLCFTSGKVELTKQRVQELLLKRRTSQPLDKFNCGSVFRNPPGDYAARLIEACGLKGKRIGGAVVSEKHANFIINDGTATAKDIENLMEHVMAKVAAEFGITLKREVKVLGSD